MKKMFMTGVLATLALAAAGGDVIKRGAPISDAKPIALAKVLEAPDAFTKTPVVVEGVIEMACTRKGCWMQFAAEKGKPGVRVTFKDYAYFIPLDAKGMKARIEGVSSVKTLTKAEADHLAEEGAKIERNADGTAREISMIATGVELWR